MQFCIEEKQVMETGRDLPKTTHNRDGLEFMPLASEALTLCSSSFSQQIEQNTKLYKSY